MEDHTMRDKTITFDKSSRRKIAELFTVFAAFIFILWIVPSSLAQQPNQRTFQSAEAASGALFGAAQQQVDRALLDILGPAGKEIISSGDSVEDVNDRVGFVTKYEQMHRLAKGTDHSMTLYVGAENWPFPIPIVGKNGVWYFDTDAGKEEIVSRRVGKNELTAIDACQQLVEAEKQYYSKSFQGGHKFADRFVSEKGGHNGLFWSEAADEFKSPLDPLIAAAGVQKATGGDNTRLADDPMPYNGYFFRILTGQGSNAHGGAKNYLLDGKLVAGFAFVAYPAEYRSSGVKTFIVNQDGVIYEKDLGSDTSKLANGVSEFNPDSTWERVE